MIERKDFLMKSELRISTGAVRTAADRISGEKEHMECEFQELQERISGALNSWLSEASVCMAEKFSDIRERCCLSFFPGIQEFTHVLRISAGEGYEEAETENRAVVSRFSDQFR